MVVVIVLYVYVLRHFPKPFSYYEQIKVYIYHTRRNIYGFCQKTTNEDFFVLFLLLYTISPLFEVYESFGGIIC